MDWRVKGAIQKALHYMLQRYAGGLRDFGRECDLKVDDWSQMMGHLRAVGVPVAGATLVEIGTGWYPTLPFCMYLAGVARVHTFDVNRLLEADLMRELADRLGAHVTLIARDSRRSEREVTARQLALATAIAKGGSLGEVTGGIIDYRAPVDVERTTLAPGSVDVVFSNSVLEHMSRSAIVGCFLEAMRVLRPGGVMVHAVNCGDHSADLGDSIDQLHASDFVELAKRAGFAIEVETTRGQHAIASLTFVARKS